MTPFIMYDELLSPGWILDDIIIAGFNGPGQFISLTLFVIVIHSQTFPAILVHNSFRSIIPDILGFSSKKPRYFFRSE